LNIVAKEPAFEQSHFTRSIQRNIRGWILVAGSALLLYLYWLIMKPFLPALCWAFGLALVGQPFHRWLCLKMSRPNLTAAISEVAIVLLLIAPAILVVRVLVIETSEFARQITSEGQSQNLRSEIQENQRVRAVLDWLDARADIRQEAARAARALAIWASSSASSAVTGSVWFVAQIIIMVYVLFYFLRDGPLILDTISSVLPLSPADTQRISARVAQTIRMSLYGKLLVSVQGSLGGLMFWWVGLPAPVLWGFLMVLVSAFPLLGAFVVWCPAAAILALQAQWGRALLLTAWGLLVIHPVDNFLGPILVRTTLRLHTLLVFFAVIGGVVAFGSSGFVLGPVILAVAVALFEIQKARASSCPPAKLPS
jgi:predicted PurR-regulated permease PerM